MSLEQHAERELRLAGAFDKDSDYGGMLGDAVMELVRVFANQGHSGASAALAIQMFSIVAGYRNLSPITGAEDEWNELAAEMYPAGHPQVFQNNRASSVFKDGKDGPAYFLDAIIWRTQKGTTWTGTAQLANGKRIGSRQYIKKFPFTPRSFYIDVLEEEVKKGEFVFHVKDLNQLREVWKEYDEFVPHEPKPVEVPPATTS